jgi:butyryl-CoA dehydrogenase
MEQDYTEDEILLRDTLGRFAREQIAPKAAELDEAAVFPREHLRKLAALGVMGMNLPERWGGPGVTAPGLALVVEEIAGACAATASVVTAHFLASDAILLGGADDLRQRYLPAAATGEMLGAFALTEPGAGSNPADMRMTARRVGTGYRLEGVKHFISNGGVCDFVVVFAVTDPTAGSRGISAFVVDKGTKGFAAGAPQPTMGLRGGHIFELSFDCRVPGDNRIGPEGSGFKTALRALDNGRVEVAAMCLGIARAAFEAALEWSKQRVVSDRPLAAYQGLGWMLADIATQLDAARLLTLRAARLRQAGERFTTEAAMAKLYASEMAGKVTDLALQIHGGYGYCRDLPLERYLRDVRIMRIYEGASEVQRNIIAGALLRGAG